jgi:hypothetical protein
MWTFFFYTALFFSIVIVSFFFLFYNLIAPMVVAYLIKTSFPPHTNHTADLIREVMDDHEMAKLREEFRATICEVYAKLRALGGRSPPPTPRLTPADLTEPSRNSITMQILDSM